MQWTPDGSTILFTRGPVLSAVTADGRRAWPVADAGVSVAEDRSGTTRRLSGTTIPFDISPDGRQVVHATCRYGVHPAVAGNAVLGYELALVGVNGKNGQRLTANTRFDSHPAWSPDGGRIAHVFLGIVRVGPAGGESQNLPIEEVVRQAPAWSPDGRQLAVATEGGVFLVEADGANPQQITDDVVGGPAWSPDGTRLALVRPWGHEVALMTIAADGTDERRLANFIGWPDGDAANAWMPTVAWSPDGSKIVVVLQPGSGRPWKWDVILEPRRKVYVVTVAGPGHGQVRPITGGSLRLSSAAWSPDGSRLAVAGVPDGRYDIESWADLPVTVFTVSADGQDRQFVAARSWDGQLEPWNALRPHNPDHLRACRRSGTVPDSASNPGLVDDCAALLSLWARRTHSGHANWIAARPLDEWDGVGLGGTPPRVRELRLQDGGLGGRDARALRWLTELRRLDLSNFGLSYIPREVGQLKHLEEVRLTASGLHGRVPAELGQLTSLRYLDLSQNHLTQPIPPELGHLTNLTFLDLSYNQLTGPIPAELSQLAGLREVRLAGNALTGCVPPGLPVMDREELGLPECEAAA